MKLRKERPPGTIVETPADTAVTSDAEDMPEERRHRRRFSGFFGKKKGKEVQQELAPPPAAETVNDTAIAPLEPSPGATPNQDSAYASSATASHARSEAGDNNVVPIENTGQIQGVNQDRNLALNKLTGDVQDKDTGEVVSTVTTTTTTTTTTTLTRGKDGKPTQTVEVSTQPTSTAAARPTNGTNNTHNHNRDSIVSEMPADPIPRKDEDAPPVPPVPSNSATPRPSESTNPPRPSDSSASYHTPQASDTSSYHAPDIPRRSPNRRSGGPGDFGERPPGVIPETVQPVPASPIVGSTFGANFSHPRRSSLHNNTAIPTVPEQAAAPPVPATYQPAYASTGPEPTLAPSAIPESATPRTQPSLTALPQMTHTSPTPTPTPQAPSYAPGTNTIEDNHSASTSSTTPLSSTPSNTGSLGAFANLKAAAKGIHGVGETLRGTLNNEIDSRFPRRNADKAAIANAKNQAALDRGQTEMAGIPQNVRGESVKREHSIARKPVAANGEDGGSPMGRNW